MSPSELKEWYYFIEQAPESIRQFLKITFWVLVSLILIGASLRVLFSKQFKELYRIIGIGAKKAAAAGKFAAHEATKSLALPEPYPRLSKILSIIFMLVNYATSFYFVCFLLTFLVLLILSSTTNFWGRTGGMLFSALLGYFAWFFFAQGEHVRVRLKKQEVNVE